MNNGLTVHKKRPADTVMYGLIYLCAGLSVALLIVLLAYVLVKGIGAVNWQFLTTVTSVLKGTVGIAGNLLNTLIIVLLTMLIATPLGVGAAVYLNEYAKPGKLVSIIEFATETLSGIPSIIFGLFGSMFFGETLGLGYSLLTGALTLILMVLPLITRNTQEALKTVPDSYRSGALGLGAGKWYMIRTVLLPSAAPGILTGAILAIGRIVGESAALRRRVGMVFQQPNPFPMSIYDNVAYGPRVHGIRNKHQLDEIVEESLRGAAIWDEVKDRLKKSALGLSGGQQQRLCIARALAVQPEVLLMDEPTSALDPISTAKIEDLMESLKKRYTVVVVTHNMQQATRVSDYTAFFLLGDLIEFGQTQQVFSYPKEKKTEDYITGRFG